MSGSKRTVAALPSEICVEVFVRLPHVNDKLRLASACRAFREASKDPRAWKKCQISTAESPRTKVGIIWALSKHAQHVEHMRCTSKGVEMLLLLEAAWSYLPKLQRLAISMPLETLQRPTGRPILPSSIRAFELGISHRSPRQASLDKLQSYAPVLTNLLLDATDYVYNGSHGYGYGQHQQRQHPQILFNSIDLPFLSKIRLIGPHIFDGQLAASCLTHITIENHVGIAWKHFNQCRTISNIQISSNSIIDFTGGEPLSLASVQFISLEAAIVEEDGAFQGLETSRLQQLTLKVKALAGRPSRFKLDRLHADVGLMCKLEAAGGSTIFSVSRRSCT